MPFTLFHLGPALALGYLLRKKLDFKTFILANISNDIEPPIVIFFNLKYPLHGFLHTLIGGMVLGTIISTALYLIDKKLEKTKEYTKYLFSGVAGCEIHVLLDSPLYSDIKPLYPLDLNPLYYPQASFLVYGLCVSLFIIGLLIVAVDGTRLSV